jgi:LuxR family transcriptional regulator, regulator of acetate metabolism
MIPPRSGQASVSAALRTLATLRRAERELVTARAQRRVDALDRVRDALHRLGEVGSPEGFLQRAADELGAGSEFDRVLISEVRDDTLVPHAVWVRDEPDPGATAARLQGISVRLGYPLAEAEVARTRRPALVPAGGRSPAALRDALGLDSYVVVALALSGATAGMLHADAARPLDDVDLRIAALYAEGLSRAFERAALYRTLQRHRQELRAAVGWMSERLTHAQGLADITDESAGDAPHGDLTAREAEVMGLLARGMTNVAIARALVISEGTVKYHVKNILRKLQATSRADAVAKFLRGPS